MTDGQHRVLYTGVTGDLRHCISEHRENLTGDRIRPHHVAKLACFEPLSDVHAALERAKAVKQSSKRQKTALITAINPRWEDQPEELP